MASYTGTNWEILGGKAENSLLALLRGVAHRVGAWQSGAAQTKGSGMAEISLDEASRGVAFTYAVIALAAKLSAVDGEATRAEYLAFRALFPTDVAEDHKIRTLFAKAMHDGSPVEQYARQIAKLYPYRRALHTEVLDRLLKVASSDVELNTKELELLAKTAKIFGFTRAEWHELVRKFTVPQMSDPYQVLGISRQASLNEVKREYMRLVRAYHPDRHQAQKASADVVEIMSAKLAAVNAAYELVSREMQRNAKGAKR